MPRIDLYIDRFLSCSKLSGSPGIPERTAIIFFCLIKRVIVGLGSLQYNINKIYPGCNLQCTIIILFGEIPFIYSIKEDTVNIRFLKSLYRAFLILHIIEIKKKVETFRKRRLSSTPFKRTPCTCAFYSLYKV